MKNKSSKYLLLILNKLKELGLGNMSIVSTNNPSILSQVIESVYLKTEMQKCIIHQMKNPIKFVSYRFIKN